MIPSSSCMGSTSSMIWLGTGAYQECGRVRSQREWTHRQVVVWWFPAGGVVAAKGWAPVQPSEQRQTKCRGGRWFAQDWAPLHLALSCTHAVLESCRGTMQRAGLPTVSHLVHLERRIDVSSYLLWHNVELSNLHLRRRAWATCLGGMLLKRIVHIFIFESNWDSTRMVNWNQEKILIKRGLIAVSRGRQIGINFVMPFASRTYGTFYNSHLLSQVFYIISNTSLWIYLLVLYHFCEHILVVNIIFRHDNDI